MQVSLFLGDMLGELRGTNEPDFGYLFSIKDFINMIKGKPYGDTYGNSTWNALIQGEYGAELNKLAHKIVLEGI